MQVLGRFRVIGEIARGGSGAVLRAHDPQLRRDVAIKLLHGARRDRVQAQERLLREARSLARLRHPNVVSVTEVGELDGAPYLVLEYVEGETLAERLEREERLAPQEALALTRKLALALDHAHRHGVIHRDVKPDNVLIDLQGEPRLTDFGLARELDPRDGERLSTEGAIQGTPGYLAPEQAAGDLDAIGPATDIWGLGATFYELLCGRPPYAQRTLMLLLDAMQEPPPPPSQLRPELSPRLDAVCRRCLALDPRERYASAAELLQDLERLQSQPSSSTSRRHSAWLLLAASLLIAGGSVVFALSAAGPPRSPPAVASSPSAPAGDGPRAGEPGSPLQRAEELLARHDAQAALPLIEEALRAEPNSARAHFLHGEACLDAGDQAAACRSWERALELDPGHLRARVRVVRRDQELHRLDEARAGARALLDAHPQSSLGWSLLAEVEEARQDWASARAAYDRLLALQPEDPDALLGRGRVCLRQGALEDALQDLTRYVELEPGDADAYVTLARVYRRLKRLPEAARAYEQAVLLDPRSEQGLIELAILRFQQDDFARALELAQRAERVAPGHPQVSGIIGASLVGLQRFQEALPYLNRCLSALPEEAEWHVARAYAHYHLGHLDASLRDSSQAIRLAPGHARPWIARGLVEIETNDLEQAQADLSRAVELDPSNAGALSSLAEVLVGLERWGEALQRVDALLRLAPNHSRVHLYRGLVLGHLRRYDEAMRELDRQLELQPGDTGAQLLRAEALWDLRRGDEARAVVADVLSRQDVAPEDRAMAERLRAKFAD